MAEKTELRANIKFCVKLKKTAVETFSLLRQAYGNDAICKATCYEWYTRFKNGRTSLDDDARSGRPSAAVTPENVTEIEQIVRQDRRITIAEVASMPTCHLGPFRQF